MKSKVTITLDSNLIPEMKESAEKEGKSLSALIEELLKQHSQKHSTPFSSKWRGSFVAMTDSEPRRAYLWKRYS